MARIVRHSVGMTRHNKAQKLRGAVTLVRKESNLAAAITKREVAKHAEEMERLMAQTMSDRFLKRR